MRSGMHFRGSPTCNRKEEWQSNENTEQGRTIDLTVGSGKLRNSFLG